VHYLEKHNKWIEEADVHNNSNSVMFDEKYANKKKET
jgi:hypothetical protein